MNKKVILGLSGGIDSAVAAYLLKKAGYGVVGLYIDVGVGGRKGLAVVKAVAGHLGIELKVKRSYAAFKKKIIDDYAAGYLNALTPNPCVRCNRLIKFEELFAAIKKNKARYAATGHYARVAYDKNNNRYFVRKARDKNKDQSYFLYTLRSAELSRLLFPLGGMAKDHVRSLAEACGLDKLVNKESQEVCFVPGKDHAAFLKRNYGIRLAAGRILDTQGKTIGRHKGLALYTVGQRKGMGVAYKEPLYVIKLNGSDNSLIAGTKKWLYNNRINIEQVFLNCGKEPGKALEVKIKIRHRHNEAAASLKRISNNVWQADFFKKQRAATPGQSAVFYRQGKIIGGGIIKEVISD